MAVVCTDNEGEEEMGWWWVWDETISTSFELWEDDEDTDTLEESIESMPPRETEYPVVGEDKWSRNRRGADLISESQMQLWLRYILCCDGTLSPLAAGIVATRLSQFIRCTSCMTTSLPADTITQRSFYCAAHSPDQRYLLAGTSSGEIFMWDLVAPFSRLCLLFFIGYCNVSESFEHKCFQEVEGSRRSSVRTFLCWKRPHQVSPSHSPSYLPCCCFLDFFSFRL